MAEKNEYNPGVSQHRQVLQASISWEYNVKLRQIWAYSVYLASWGKKKKNEPWDVDVLDVSTLEYGLGRHH